MSTTIPAIISDYNPKKDTEIISEPESDSISHDTTKSHSYNESDSDSGSMSGSISESYASKYIDIESNSNNTFLDYFDDITSVNDVNTLNVKPLLKTNACPVPLDYFAHNTDTLMFFPVEKILSLHIAKEFKLTKCDIAINGDNVQEIFTLMKGNPLKCKPNMIPSGIIAGNEKYLVLVGEPNRKGYPGRLFIVYSNRFKLLGQLEGAKIDPLGCIGGCLNFFKRDGSKCSPIHEV